MTTEPNFTAGQEPEGKVAALIAWALFILSIPSANVLVLVGLVVSYVARGTAVGVARRGGGRARVRKERLGPDF